MSDTGQIGGFDHEKVAQMLAEAEPGVDRRARRTRQALHQALMRLVVERGYEEITVGDIADLANVGRSTFYAHFTDKDDLLRSAAGNLRAIVIREHAAYAAASGAAEDRVLGFSHFLTHHLYEQRQLLHALMRGAAGVIILGVLRQVLSDVVRGELSKIGIPAKGNPGREFAVQYIVGSYVSMMTWWLERGAKEKPDVLHAAYRTMAKGGISALLRTAVAA